MAHRDDPNPLDEEVNPFSVMSPTPSLSDKKKAKELATLEEDLRRRETDIKRREDALSHGGVSTEEKNWPPFFPIIHHDIAKEIPLHARRLQYLAFASWLGMGFALCFAK